MAHEGSRADCSLTGKYRQVTDTSIPTDANRRQLTPTDARGVEIKRFEGPRFSTRRQLTLTDGPFPPTSSGQATPGFNLELQL